MYFNIKKRGDALARTSSGLNHIMLTIIVLNYSQI